MNSPIDPETLRIPAYLRKKAIVNQAKQKLILTALDRKLARLPVTSKKATAPLHAQRESARTYTNKGARVKSTLSTTPQNFEKPVFELNRTALSPKKLIKIGVITHYLDNINVAIIKLNAALKIGDLIIAEGEDYLFLQPVEEIQIDRKPINKAKNGDHIGMKVIYATKINGSVYKFPVRM